MQHVVYVEEGVALIMKYRMLRFIQPVFLCRLDKKAKHFLIGN